MGAWHLEMEREFEFSVRYLSYASVTRSFETLISICLSLGLGVCSLPVPWKKSRIEHFFLTSENEQ